MRRGLGLLAFPALFLFLFFFRPLWAMLGEGLDGGAWQWIGGAFVQARLAGAFQQAALSVLLTLVVAIPLAWIHHQYDIRWSRVHMAIFAAPFVLPVFVIVFGMQAVTQGWGMSPIAAIAMAHAYYNIGFATRLLHTALERRPRTLEAAAATLGAPPAAAFVHTTLRLLAPQLVAVALLVFLFAFSSFGVVLYMGGNQVSTLETLMYGVLRGAFAQPERAAALGILQLGFNAMLLLAYTWLLRRQEGLAMERQPKRPAAWAPWASWTAVALTLWPALLVLVGGFQVRGDWSLEPWRALLDVSHASHAHGFHLSSALGLTAFYALCSATLAITLTLCLAYAARSLPRARSMVDALSAIPLGTSSLLIGFGYVLSFGVQGFLHVWSGRGLIIAAHTLIAFPFTARVLLPAIGGLDGRMDQAARTLGAAPGAVWWRIHMPTLRAPLLAALGFALAMSVGDFGASLLLQKVENRSLSVWIDAHASANGFNPLLRAQAVALAGLLMLVSMGCYMLMERGQRA